MKLCCPLRANCFFFSSSFFSVYSVMNTRNKITDKYHEQTIINWSKLRTVRSKCIRRPQKHEETHGHTEQASKSLKKNTALVKVF